MVKKLGIGCLGIIAILVVVGIIGAIGNSGGSSGDNSAAVAKAGAATATPAPVIGDTVTKGNWAYMVTKVEKAKSVSWSQFGNKSDAKGTFLIVTLGIQNVGKETYPVNAWDFEVQDGSGVKYKTALMESSTYSGYLGLSKVGDNYPPGVPAAMALLFDINPNATGLKLNLVQAKTMVALE